MGKPAPIKAPAVSRGFNLDSLGGGAAELLSGYDQIQIKNGNQNLLLQRAVSGSTVAPKADISAGGNLQVVPDAGPKAAAYLSAQKAAKPATPVWEKYGLWIGGGLLAAGGAYLILRRK